MRSRPLGMDDTLRDPLAIKVGKQVDQVEILQQEGSIETRSLGGVRVGNGDSVRGGVDAVGQYVRELTHRSDLRILRLCLTVLFIVAHGGRDLVRGVAVRAVGMCVSV
jgi:hypothetical protein